MLLFDHIVRYWFGLDLPIAELLRANHTLFSEESGEVALSVLAHAQPPNNRSGITQARKYWFLTAARYKALRVAEAVPRVKKARVIGNILLHLYSDHCTLAFSPIVLLESYFPDVKNKINR